MSWADHPLRESSKLLGKGIKHKDFPYWLKFRLRLLHIRWYYLNWSEIKTGWKTIREMKKGIKKIKRLEKILKINQ